MAFMRRTFPGPGRKTHSGIAPPLRWCSFKRIHTLGPVITHRRGAHGFQDSAQEGEFRVEVRKFLDAHAPLRTKSTWNRPTPRQKRTPIGSPSPSAGRASLRSTAGPASPGRRPSGPGCNPHRKRDLEPGGLPLRVTPDGLFIIGQGMCAPTLWPTVTTRIRRRTCRRSPPGKVWCPVL